MINIRKKRKRTHFKIVFFLLMSTMSTTILVNAKYVSKSEVTEIAKVAKFDVEIIEESGKTIGIDKGDLNFTYEGMVENEIINYVFLIINHSEVQVSIRFTSDANPDFIELDIPPLLILAPKKSQRVPIDIKINRVIGENRELEIDQSFHFGFFIEQVME